MWVDATAAAEKETGIDLCTFPELCPWVMADVLTENWLPD
jgi:hypothetical protein